MSEHITYDHEKVRKLERAYIDAVLNRQPDFVFEHKVLDTAYAKYLLEYLKTVFPTA